MEQNNFLPKSNWSLLPWLALLFSMTTIIAWGAALYDEEINPILISSTAIVSIVISWVSLHRKIGRKVVSVIALVCLTASILVLAIAIYYFINYAYIGF